MVVVCLVGFRSFASAQAELFKDKTEYFVRCGSSSGLGVGSVVLVLGESIGDTGERRSVGRATVMEVWAGLARVSLDEATKQFVDDSRLQVFVSVPEPEQLRAVSPPHVDSIPVSVAPVAARNPFTIHRQVAMWGLIASWGITVITAALLRDNFFLTSIIPIFGPVITVARIKADPYAYNLLGNGELSYLSTIVQGLWATYLVISVIGEANYQPPQFGVTLGPAPLGLSVFWRI